MALVVKKVADPVLTTHQVVRSANTPDYPTEDWLINPAGAAALDASAVPVKYWDVNAGVTDVEEMTQGEKDAVDAAAVVPLNGIAQVAADPTSTAVDADEGTILVHGANLYRKITDGENTDAVPIGDYRVKTGSYTGDDSTSQAITGVGFQPKYVRIWKRDVTPDANIVIVETTDTIMDDHADKGAVLLSATVADFDINRIISFDADGFTVDDSGTNIHPNIDGTVYNYLAIG